MYKNLAALWGVASMAYWRPIKGCRRWERRSVDGSTTTGRLAGTRRPKF